MRLAFLILVRSTRGAAGVGVIFPDLDELVEIFRGHEEDVPAPATLDLLQEDGLLDLRALERDRAIVVPLPAALGADLRDGVERRMVAHRRRRSGVDRQLLAL